MSVPFKCERPKPRKRQLKGSTNVCKGSVSMRIKTIIRNIGRDIVKIKMKMNRFSLMKGTQRWSLTQGPVFKSDLRRFTAPTLLPSRKAELHLEKI